MKKQWIIGFGLCFTILPYLCAASAQQRPQNGGAGSPQAGWSSFSRGGAVHQFDSDLEQGGSFGATRFNIEAGQGYSWNRRNSVSLSVSYSYDGYSFGPGERGMAASNPWDDVHSISLALPARWGFGDDWSTIVIPSIRSSGESGSDFEDTITGGMLAGVNYRFSDRLTIGPGIGVISQLEDSATVFPVLIIDWRITDRLSLETGRGLAATVGPGLTLKYAANERWSMLVGGRYEKLRFRLADSGSDPGGVGEDASFPLFASITYSFSPLTSVSMVGGAELGGELKQEDNKGRSIAEESYDSAGFLGFTFSVRL
ncbi:MAG: hypothetical protein LJE64_11220 [Desulfofustis sp.]|nr:hypothetical protein [Desulfofustis sp.]